MHDLGRRTDKRAGEVTEMKNMMISDCMDGREPFQPEVDAAWCRIEELSRLCGYDPMIQFGLLRKIPDIYPRLSGRDPDEIAEEHPMQALAILIRRFLDHNPETAAERNNVSAPEAPGKRLPEKAA